MYFTFVIWNKFTEKNVHINFYNSTNINYFFLQMSIFLHKTIISHNSLGERSVHDRQITWEDVNNILNFDIDLNYAM